jgi:hypothetical protein
MMKKFLVEFICYYSLVDTLETLYKLSIHFLIYFHKLKCILYVQVIFRKKLVAQNTEIMSNSRH